MPRPTILAMVVLVALTAANCVLPPRLVVANHSGAPIVIVNGERRHALGPGEISRRMPYLHEGHFSVESGACVYTYRGPDWAAEPTWLDSVKETSPDLFKRAGGYALDLAIEVAPDFTLRAFVHDFINRKTAPLAAPELHAGGFPLTSQRDCAAQGS